MDPAPTDFCPLVRYISDVVDRLVLQYTCIKVLHQRISATTLVSLISASTNIDEHRIGVRKFVIAAVAATDTKLEVDAVPRSQRSLDHKPRASLSTCSVHRKHDLGRFLLERTIPTDFFGNVRERKQMHRKLGIVHSAAYDLVFR
jgi:hypothetical protein